MALVLLTVGFGLVTASVIAFAAVAVTLQFGITNYVNFASGSYMGLGAFVTWEANVRGNLNFWVSLVIGTASVAVFAAIVDWAVLARFARKFPPVTLLVVTFALWFVVSNGMLAIWGANEVTFSSSSGAGGNPISIGPLRLTPDELITIALAVVAMIGVSVLLRRTTLGRSLRAMSDDRELAQVSGLNTARLTTITWLLTGALLGLGGSLLALDYVTFAPGFADILLFVIFAAVIVGGIGQPYGAMLGALLMGVATEVSVNWISASYKYDVAFVALILALLLRPQGLLPARGRN
jgi:branched-subunit amino acid ABC-type transport system permease component